MTRAKKPAFLPLYRQIPTVGTEYSSAQVRASQAAPTPSRLPELTAFKKLKVNGCDVVPDLLGYNEGQQGPNDINPGGYDTTIVWDKVPGDPLLEQYLWNLTLEGRA
ncbi:hypothetical protein PENNAL_c0011G09244 [Penicillium nalgiovense]|uniref:Uncharacterized protein n=1 Tax=Penicillium nalgiovense TaxID=60175 RepID=A0A1V6YU27_PENNA|nr:hypothetical protein PENNAL_c0011G09244 [Penicillium nalgiovense]